eukprot:gene12243-13504_t
MSDDEKNNNIKKLKTIANIPQHLAFNKYVIHGYRTNYSFIECLKRLFAVYLFSLFPYQDISTHNHGMLQVLHWFASILPFLGSTIYHLFMCHSTGSATYCKLLKLDVTGIWAVNSFGYVIAVYSTFHGLKALQIAAVVLYVTCSFITLYFLLKATTPIQRFVPLCYYLVVRPIIMITRAWLGYYSPCNHSNGERLQVGTYVMMDLVALCGALVNVGKFPERFMPGRFDIFMKANRKEIAFSAINLRPRSNNSRASHARTCGKSSSSPCNNSLASHATIEIFPPIVIIAMVTFRPPMGSFQLSRDPNE